MHKIVAIEKMVKQNQNNVMKITKRGYKNKQETVTETSLKTKRPKWRI